MSAEDKFAQTNDDTGSTANSSDDGGFGAFFDDEPEEEVVAEEVVEEEDSAMQHDCKDMQKHLVKQTKNIHLCFGCFIQKQEKCLVRLTPLTKRTCQNLFLLTV